MILCEKKKRREFFVLTCVCDKQMHSFGHDRASIRLFGNPARVPIMNVIQNIAMFISISLFILNGCCVSPMYVCVICVQSNWFYSGSGFMFCTINAAAYFYNLCNDSLENGKIIFITKIEQKQQQKWIYFSFSTIISLSFHHMHSLFILHFFFLSIFQLKF